MKCGLVILASVLVLAKQSLAESCNTCRGMACAAKTVSQKSCDDYLPPLPFESLLMFNEVDDNAKYGCLNLKYYISGSLEEVQQCVLSNDLNSYCAILETTLNVKSCKVEETLEERVERSADGEEDLLSIRNESNDDAEEEDDDTTDSPDDLPTTTDSAELARTIPFACLIGLLLVLLY